jgi:hypothetical protein
MDPDIDEGVDFSNRVFPKGGDFFSLLPGRTAALLGSKLWAVSDTF